MQIKVRIPIRLVLKIRFLCMTIAELNSLSEITSAPANFDLNLSSAGRTYTIDMNIPVRV
jgi:hypothetical protein